MYLAYLTKNSNCSTDLQPWVEIREITGHAGKCVGHKMWLEILSRFHWHAERCVLALTRVGKAPKSLSIKTSMLSLHPTGSPWPHCFNSLWSFSDSTRQEKELLSRKKKSPSSLPSIAFKSKVKKIKLKDDAVRARQRIQLLSFLE